jgi:hypothetical protein
MFEEHSSFIPIRPTERVWRYLDFTKFVSLLDSRALWFTRPRMFRDPWELAVTRANLNRLAPGLKDDTVIAGLHGAIDSFLVNCWHLNHTESAAMWDLYLPSGHGVAIQSTWGRLTGAVPQDSPPVFGGAVRYLDYETDETWDESNIFFPVGTKRLSFAHEREARLVLWLHDPRTRAAGVDPSASGVPVPISLATAVERVVLAPGTEAWFKELVRRIAHLLEFECEIEDSAMDAEPITLEALLNREAVTTGEDATITQREESSDSGSAHG